MAIAWTELDHGNSATDAATISSGVVAFTPATDRVFVAILVHSKGTAADAPSAPTGASGTWTIQHQSAGTSGSLKRITVYKCIDATGSEAVTWDFGGTNQTGFIWYILQGDGVDNGGTQGADAFVQTILDNNSSADVELTNTFAQAYGAANGALYIAEVNDTSPNFVEEDGFTALTGETCSAPAMSVTVAWMATNPASTTISVGSDSNQGMFRAYEIKAADVGGVAGTSTSNRTTRRRRR